MASTQLAILFGMSHRTRQKFSRITRDLHTASLSQPLPYTFFFLFPFNGNSGKAPGICLNLQKDVWRFLAPRQSPVIRWVSDAETMKFRANVQLRLEPVSSAGARMSGLYLHREQIRVTLYC